jgi:hypothetical protein
MSDHFDCYIRNWCGLACIESNNAMATEFLLRMDGALNGVLNDQGNVGGIPEGRSFLPISGEMADAILMLSKATGLHVPATERGRARQ